MFQFDPRLNLHTLHTKPNWYTKKTIVHWRLVYFHAIHYYNAFSRHWKMTRSLNIIMTKQAKKIHMQIGVPYDPYSLMFGLIVAIETWMCHILVPICFRYEYINWPRRNMRQHCVLSQGKQAKQARFLCIALRRNSAGACVSHTIARLHFGQFWIKNIIPEQHLLEHQEVVVCNKFKKNSAKYAGLFIPLRSMRYTSV